MNSFVRLGLDLSLVVPIETLERHYQKLAKSAHPDAGGSESEFSEILSAYEELKSPARRIKAAVMSLQAAPEERGAVPSQVVDLFSPVASALEEVEGFLEDRAQARSGLARALFDAKVPELNKTLNSLQQELAELESAFIAKFPSIDAAGWQASLSEMKELSRGLAFLEKWRAQLRGATGKLFEVLLGGAT